MVLFCLLQLAVPVLCTVYFGAHWFWLVGSTALCLAIVISSDRRDSRFRTLCIAFTSLVFFAANLLLGASYYMQGEGFNGQFFYHLDVESFAMARRSYASLFYLSAAGLLTAFFTPFFLRRATARAQFTASWPRYVWLLAVITNYPVLSYVSYSMDEARQPQGFYSQGAELRPSEREYLKRLAATPGAFRKKNVILIYAESLEQLYFDQAVFGVDLLPRLRALADQSHRFVNVTQVRDASATITGLIASQCGFPVTVSTHLAVNSTISSVEQPFPDEKCLADVLSDSGYRTVFMGGAPLSFAGKGNFLNTHGYAAVYGEEELTRRLQNPEYTHEWGLYDDSLFDLAQEELAALEQSDERYLLTLLTVDTHHPAGFLSKSCESLPGKPKELANAIFCSDQLISDFISDAMATVDMENTVIVLFSDHLSMRNQYWSVLTQQQSARRLNFMIFDNQPGESSAVEATHFDVAPTILEAAGIPGNLKIGAGSSLFYREDVELDSAWASRRAVSGPSLLAPTTSVADEGLLISAADLSLSIGDSTFRASADGREFVSGMYMLVFGDDGFPLDAVYTRDYASLAGAVGGKFVVGVSLFADQPDRPSYFYGRISWDGAGIVQGPLSRDVRLSPQQVSSSMNRVTELARTRPDNGFRIERVAHAGGGVDGMTYTNSYQALDSSFKRGFRYFEIDLDFTADKQLVCIHDWDEGFRRNFGYAVDDVPTLAEFEALTAINSKATNCTLDGLMDWMAGHPQARLVTDIRADNIHALNTIVSELPEARSRVIPQIYDPLQYAAVKALGFEQVILTLYRYQGNLSDLSGQVQQWQGDFAITMPINVARTGFARHLRSLGIPSYVHTVNDRAQGAQLMQDQGVAEIYTDFLDPSVPLVPGKSD